MQAIVVASLATDSSGYVRGESFSPSVAGPDGSGSVGSLQTVYLTSLTIGYATSDTTNRASTLYIYDTLPSLSNLNSHSGALYSSDSTDDGSAFGTGTFTRTFDFNYIGLDPSKTYFFLFATNQNVTLQTGNPYSGGAMESTLLVATNKDLQFQVNMQDSLT